MWLPSKLVILKSHWVTKTGMLWGISLAYLAGQSMFLYGQLNKVGLLSLAGTITAIVLSPVLVAAISSVTKKPAYS